MSGTWPGQRVESSQMAFVPLRKRLQRAPLPSATRAHVSQKAGSLQTLNLLLCSFGTSRPPEEAERSLCCVSATGARCSATAAPTG